MELKHNHRVAVVHVRKVLIVLYGIETKLSTLWGLDSVKVLIVLYGIETKLYSQSYGHKKVLIVLYGIETEATIAAQYTAGGS